MEIQPLTVNEAAMLGGFTHRIKVTHADLTTALDNTAQAITAIVLKAGDNIGPRLATKLVTPFKEAANAGLNTTTLTIGDAGSAARFLASQELNENGTEIDFKIGTGTQYVYTGAETLLLTFGSMAAENLAQLDTGEVHIFIQLSRLNDLPPAIA